MSISLPTTVLELAGVNFDINRLASSTLLLLSLCVVAGNALAQTPTLIRPADSLPKSTPWDLIELSKVPKFKWADGEAIRSLRYEGETYKGKPTQVFAYYATPETIANNNATKGNVPAADEDSAQKQFPAIVLVHGGGGTAFPNWCKLWAERGYAAIAMDLAGNGPDKNRLPDGGPGQGHDMKFETIGQPVTEQWTYHAVSNVIRAHSLVRSFPEVDSTRTAITGISWGGYLTCIVAGLDDRFQAAVPVYGCGFLQDNSCWLGDFAKMTPEHQNKWVQLWEPSQYVGSATMPMLFVNGGKDFAYPPDSHARTFALVQSPTYLHYVPDLAHGHIFDKPKAIEYFVDHQLKKTGEPLARIAKPQTDKGQVTAKVETSTPLVKANLHFTDNNLSGDANARTWTNKPATIEGELISADPPPTSATAWFLTVTDTRETLTSSPLVITEPSANPSGAF